MNTQMRREAEINLNRAVQQIEEYHNTGGRVSREDYLLASIAYSLIRLGDLAEERQ